MAKNKMPPELLEHFKKKAAKKEGKDVETDENKKESDNSRRKEAVKKARVKMEERVDPIVTSKKKLVKNALKQPEFFAPEEIMYMQFWLSEHKRQKQAKN